MEDAAWFGATNPASRIALIAATYADARDTMVEGDSGLLSRLPSSFIQTWNRSLGELILINGTRYKLFAATEPERLRGPQHSRAYCDELAAWEKAETWDQMLFGLRLGAKPKVIIATTPRPTPLLRRIVADPATHVTRGSTFDNAANLARTTLEQLKAKYEGTRLGRQELNAEILSDTPGALWTREMIDAARKPVRLPDMQRIVVAVDPSGARNQTDEGADEIGIVVAGRGDDGRGYVLADYSLKDSPGEWAKRAVKAYNDYSADAIIAERNFGGAMVEYTLRSVDRSVSYREVVASRGKVVRAEPVAAFYEQCVSAETLISCERGDIPIKDVRAGDFVWTRAGLKRVLWAGQTGVQPTMEISAGGCRLRLTGNHPVLTADGWIEASKLREKDRTVYIWLRSVRFAGVKLDRDGASVFADHAPPANVGKRGLFADALSGLRVFATSFKTMATGALHGITATNFSIGRSGASRMGATSPMDGTYIMSTAMRRTMSPATWWPFQAQIIRGTTTRTGCGFPAKSASAPSAAGDSSRNGESKKFAPMNAGETAVHARSANAEPVFNLHVEECHEYVANGILVHNCRVSHVGQNLETLEDQLCQFTSDGYVGEGSPDRADALVWALSELMVTGSTYDHSMSWVG